MVLDLRIFERQKNERQFFTSPKKGGTDSMNTLLRQAKKEVCRLKRNSSDYGMTEVFFYIDFSRRPEETENLIGYGAYLSALAENDGDIKKAIEASGLNRDSVVTEPNIEEPFLLCRTRVTKAQEKSLLSK